MSRKQPIVALFNTTQPAQRVYEERHIHVEEKRAPTDESVRLLREMEDAAKAQIISITKLDANEMKATWHIIEEPMNFSTKAIVRMLLNEKEHEFSVELPSKFDNAKTPQEMVLKVRDAIALKLAGILTMQLFDQHSQTLPFKYL